MFFSLWAVQNYLLIYTTFMLLPFCCLVITEKLSHETDKIVISEQHPSWHFHLCVVGARVCMSFWNCDISDKERTVKHVVMCFFLNNQRILSHTSHFRAHSHYQPAQDSYFIYQFSSSSPLPFPFKHTVLCLIYMLEYVCMLLYCVVLSVYFFFGHALSSLTRDLTQARTVKAQNPNH